MRLSENQQRSRKLDGIRRVMSAISSADDFIVRFPLDALLITTPTPSLVNREKPCHKSALFTNGLFFKRVEQELRIKQTLSEIVILAVCFQLKQLKKQPEKNSGLNGTRTHDLAIPVQYSIH